MEDSVAIKNLLLNIAERLANIESHMVLSSKELLNTKEAAYYLGVSESRLSHLSSDGEVSYYQCNGKGSKRYYKKQDLDAYCTRVRIASDADIQQQAAAYCAMKR